MRMIFSLTDSLTLTLPFLMLILKKRKQMEKLFYLTSQLLHLIVKDNNWFLFRL